MTKMKKIIAIIFCLCLSIGLFSGCSTVSYGLVQYSDGQILQSFSTILDEEVLTQNGYDIEGEGGVKEKIKSVYTNLVNDLKNDFETRILVSGNVQIYNIVMQDIRNATITDEDNVITLQILFKNLTNYRYFYNLVKDSEDDSANSDIITEYPFYNVITTKTYTKFYNYRENPYFLNAENEIKDYFAGSDFTIEDVGFNYCYGLPSSSKYKSNADYIYSQNGIDIHIWKLDSGELNKEIEFYRIQIKPMLWYVLAIGLTLILLVIIVVVCLIKNKFNKNKSDEDKIKEKQIDKIIDDYVDAKLNNNESVKEIDIN